MERIIVHPDYQLGGNYDIALLNLKRPVKPTSHVGFICLPASRSSDPPTGTLCTITGWGHTMYGAQVSPELLHSAQVPIVSRRCVCTSLPKAASYLYFLHAVSALVSSLTAGMQSAGTRCVLAGGREELILVRMTVVGRWPAGMLRGVAGC